MLRMCVGWVGGFSFKKGGLDGFYWEGDVWVKIEGGEGVSYGMLGGVFSRENMV